MTASLYTPDQLPRIVSTVGMSLPSHTGTAHVSDEVAAVLGCARSLVDVLDCGPDYVAYSIFDFEGTPNQSAMAALTAISSHPYDMEDEDQILQGPVLLVTR